MWWEKYVKKETTANQERMKTWIGDVRLVIPWNNDIPLFTGEHPKRECLYYNVFCHHLISRECCCLILLSTDPCWVWFKFRASTFITPPKLQIPLAFLSLLSNETSAIYSLTIICADFFFQTHFAIYFALILEQREQASQSVGNFENKINTWFCFTPCVSLFIECDFWVDPDDFEQISCPMMSPCRKN